MSLRHLIIERVEEAHQRQVSLATDEPTGPPELHVYLASKFPLALCGARSTLATFEEALKYQGTAGADRCGACLLEYERIRAARS